MLRKFSLIGCTCFCLWLIFSTVSGDCPVPEQPIQNGQYIFEKKTDENITMAPNNYLLSFKCSVGYNLIGAKAMLCFDGKWTSKLPICIKIQCPDPPNVQHSYYVLNKGVNSEATFGSTLTYSCDVGFQIENDTASTLTCTLDIEGNNVEWKGEIPRCLQKEACDDPGFSEDGKRKGDCCFIGDVLTYSCKDGYEVVGSDTIECLSTGKWSSRRPLCRPLDEHCELPPKIPNGLAAGEKYGDYFLPYDEVHILCEPGYAYRGSSKFVMCTEEGVWEDDFDECTEAFCDVPKPLNDGTIPELSSTNITSFPYNFELTYVCNDGFRLIGNSWRFCGEKGWSGKNPYCEAIKCPNPGVPEHGRRQGEKFEIGDKLIFTCNSGFKLIGSFERYCMPNGQWSGELTSCDTPSNYCPDPGIPINGMKNASNYDMGSSVGFRCQPGFRLIGSEARECLPNRTWSGTEAKCMGPYDFDNSATVRDIMKAMIMKEAEEQKRKLEEYYKVKYELYHKIAPVGRVLDINFPGRLILYFVFDTSGSVGELNFQKSIDFAKALVKRVHITENGARAGAVTFSSKAEVQFLPINYNTTTDVLDALDRVNYTGGGTAATSALSLVKTDMITLTKELLGTEKQKSVIFILTDGKANMGGDPQIEAEALKLAGVEIYCVGITGDDVKDSLYKIASDPKEEHVFILKNYATLAWLIEEITNGTIDYSKCGLGHEIGLHRSKITGGKVAVEPWPWMAAVYFLSPRSRDNEAELQCGGSIINQNYILTAAHCFYNRKGLLRKENEIHIKLGLTNVTNQTYIQEFEVKKLCMHPKYNYGQIFDYDIALLRLSRPVEFTAYVRPVCLPPPDLPPNSTFYKFGELALATGWGHEGVIERSRVEDIQIRIVNQLKEVILPMQSWERCMQSIKDNRLAENVFTERMFCVGDGKGGNDTCRGDSGGPIMQSQLDHDGNTYWTQVGIVSWGIGCGLPGTYGYYTHVQQLRSWIDETIEAMNMNECRKVE